MNFKDDALTPEEFLPGLYSEVPELLSELFHWMPWGQEITLSNGCVGKLKNLLNRARTRKRGRF